eukprot:6365474-Pyramimonas_sp.AAC.2
MTFASKHREEERYGGTYSHTTGTQQSHAEEMTFASKLCEEERYSHTTGTQHSHNTHMRQGDDLRLQAPQGGEVQFNIQSHNTHTTRTCAEEMTFATKLCEEERYSHTTVTQLSHNRHNTHTTLTQHSHNTHTTLTCAEEMTYASKVCEEERYSHAVAGAEETTYAYSPRIPESDTEIPESDTGHARYIHSHWELTTRRRRSVRPVYRRATIDEINQMGSLQELDDEISNARKKTNSIKAQVSGHTSHSGSLRSAKSAPAPRPIAKARRLCNRRVCIIDVY